VTILNEDVDRKYNSKTWQLKNDFLCQYETPTILEKGFSGSLIGLGRRIRPT
jgi:hypothetical protein